MTDHEPARQLTHLHALAAALETVGLRAELDGADTGSPRLHVTSLHPSALSERVTCHQPAGQPWQFYWSSRQPIGPASDPAAAAAAIATVLRPLNSPAVGGPVAEIDQTAPNAARIYDSLLGGSFLRAHYRVGRGRWLPALIREPWRCYIPLAMLSRAVSEVPLVISPLRIME